LRTPSAGRDLVELPIFRSLVPYLAYIFSSFLKLTTSVTTVRGEIRAKLRRADARFIYAFWHQRQCFFTVTHRGDNMTVLISNSRDGQMIAETIRLCCGVKAIRGSSSRGASASVRSLMTALESGLDIGITPDGPKGPAREIKSGVMFLALKLGVPILPISNAQSNRLVFKRSWDRFHLPMPFGRAAVVYGEPIRVMPGDDLVLKAAELKTCLDAITLEAEALVA
jgi:lysophospholipid acyltransferase (LPLAT)-like uncharacterized protein